MIKVILLLYYTFKISIKFEELIFNPLLSLGVQSLMIELYYIFF